MPRESEETEVKKDIEWLRREIHKELETWHGVEGGIDGDGINEIMLLINQLDEPEVLSQEWVNGNSVYASADGVTEEYVHVDDLKELLVPKQELPVIPKFVAEWYESEGKRNSWWNWFYKWGRDESRTELEAKTIRWMQVFNEEAFVNMFLHGYTVKKEQKYQVIIRDGEYMRLYLCKHDGNVTIGTNDNYIEKCPEVTYLTEQEIKDYDERYWPFAVKVEELEE